MSKMDILERIDDLEREIALLPPGSIAVKKVRGKEYFYHRVTRNKKRTETYVDFEKVEALRSQIDKRKALEAELKELKRSIPTTKAVRVKKDTHEFSTYVRIGEQLSSFTLLMIVMRLSAISLFKNSVAIVSQNAAQSKWILS